MMTKLLSANKLLNQLIVVGLLLFCHFSSCNLSKQEIPEPNYNPYVIKPGAYVQAEGAVVNQNTMMPPKETRVKGEWKTAKKLDPKQLATNYTAVSNLEHFPTTPELIDMTQVAMPAYTPSKGVIREVSWPKGVSTRISIASTSDYYMGIIDHRNGLKSDFIHCLIEDRRGRIWIGTENGVALWDGSVLVSLTLQNGLPGDRVVEILEDKNGHIWLAFLNAGVMVWNGLEFTAFSADQGLSDNRVWCLEEDVEGGIWIGTANGLNRWDGNGFTKFFVEQGLVNNFIRDLAIDKYQTLLIGTWGGGISLWDGQRFSKFTTEHGLSVNDVETILVDRNGNIWIGTGLGGLNQWNGHTLTYYGQPQGLKERWIMPAIEDSRGNIWVGGNQGAHKFDGKGFTTVSTNNGLAFSVVTSLLEDSGGRIWIGTGGGGLHCLLNPDSRHINTDEAIWYHTGFKDLIEDTKGEMWVIGQELRLLPNFNTTSIKLFDVHVTVPWKHDMSFNTIGITNREDKLIVGTNGGLKVFPKGWSDKDFPKFLFYQLGMLAGTYPMGVTSILEDHKGNIWVGTNEDYGLYFLEIAGRFADSVRILNYSLDQGLEAPGISALLEDHDGKIWIGSIAGLNVWDGQKFTRFTVRDGLTSDQVRALALDSKNNIWIATSNRGISIWDGHGFRQYTSKEGLPSDKVNSLYVDENDNVWAGIQGGLVKLWTTADGHIQFKYHHEYQGIDKSDVIDALVDSKDKLWAISQRRMDIVDLQLKLADSLKPKLAVQEVQPFFDHIDWKQVRSKTLNSEKLVTGDQELSLAEIKYDSVFSFSNLPVAPRFPYSINNLSFQWSCTYWADPTSLQYSYILEGQDQAWSPLVNENKVVYNDLRPGDYTLKVRAVAGNASWSETASYSFRVAPPIWATWWAYGLYALCALGLALALQHYEKKRFILKQKAQSLEEIDKAKTEFFTNISHELRTPLTLILGPMKAWQQGTYQGDEESLFTMISQNGRRLLKLVNQLLDLSKLDQGKLQLQLENCLVNELVESVVANFDSAAATKNISLGISGTETPLQIGIDIEKMKQVLFNLLSNAIKFTPEGGNIQVSLGTKDDWEGPSDHLNREVKIEVRDSGIGIPKEEIGNIFDRFYQVNHSKHEESEGTGIGLALAQKLVHLHKGTIEVTSEPGWGTTFTVILPVVSVTESEPSVAEPPPEPDIFYNEPVVEDAEPAEHNSSNFPLLLIVEDNAQMRHYIRTCLGEGYQYVEAPTGFEGLRMANSKLPDLILSDVMMPEMNGYEFCKQVRENHPTSHIPFIFLTAKADLDSRLQGLEIGSNDYLSKPFEAEELRLKVRNHLDRMRQYRSYFSKQLAIKGDIEAVESLDHSFLNKAIKIVQDQMENHDFTVNDFAQEIGMSKTQLYRKLITLTGQPPTGFIRSIRLKKAGQLILQDFGNVSDIAYAVGFNNLSYFTKCFKEQFGVAPSSYGKSKISS